MAPRSRTGCLTCRSRKLKCSEERPVCAQCAKANRECIAALGITFRHQQNPSMNATDHGEGSLKSFYGYKETFGKDATWVNVPRDLTFVHTTNPFEDSEDGPGGSGGYGEGDTSFMSDVTERFDESRLPGDHSLAPTSYSDYATHGLEALSAVATQDQYHYPPPSATMGQAPHTSPQQSAMNDQHASVSPSQNLDYILNPSSAGVASPAVSNIDPQLHSPHINPAKPVSASSPDNHPHDPDHVRSYSYTSSHGRPRLRSKGSNRSRDREAAIAEPELAFFLRDYAERMGFWMDIFDFGLFFSTHVPLLAVKCPLLLYSCVALSAKALARVNGRKPVMGGQVTAGGQSKTELWPGPSMNAESWFHRARQFYDLAVSLLRQALAGASRPPTNSLPEAASPSTISSVQGHALPSTDSDELVAATAILCVYEFFDISGVEWNRHLDGAKSLFDIANDKMRDLTRPPSPTGVVDQIAQHLSSLSAPRPTLGKGKRAVFWCFARQDMLSAFMNNTATRVDTSDLAAWRSAGLHIAPNGFLYPSTPSHPDFDPDKAMAEDMIGNAFIWLLAKVVNFIVLSHTRPHDRPGWSLGAAPATIELWEDLEEQLQTWYEGLPSSFTATAVWKPEPEPIGIEEKWFPRSMCASTMQWWHFAKIQMLNNKPQTATPRPTSDNNPLESPAPPGATLAQRHASYASILRQSREHAKEIVSIGLGRSDEGARVHAVQPLWTAGLVLGMSGGDDRTDRTTAETNMWRRSVVRQLRGIERDMGWASEYRVQNLLELWGLPPDWDSGEPG